MVIQIGGLLDLDRINPTIARKLLNFGEARVPNVFFEEETGQKMWFARIDADKTHADHKSDPSFLHDASQGPALTQHFFEAVKQIKYLRFGGRKKVFDLEAPLRMNATSSW